MEISFFGIAGVASITVICYLIGMIVKSSCMDGKWIPSIVGVAGLVLGLLGFNFMPDFPAGDIITAAAVGIVSGLASTGADQAVKQLRGEDK